MTPLTTTLLPLLAAAATPAPAPNDEFAQEDHYYTVDYLEPPAGEVLEVGGLGQLSDGTLVVSTRRGQVWLVSNPTADDPADAEFSLFAEGLWEGLGLNVVEDQIFVVQRGEISKLVDADDDGVCDRVDTLTDDWGLSGNYHEFAYGLPRDAAGNFYVALNVSFFSPEWWHGKSTVPYRGWILKVSPDGTVQPFASGLRSPCGLSIDGEGRLLATDNQGDWMAASPVIHVQEGAWYGHPASLTWTEQYRAAGAEPSDTVPPERASSERTPPAVWLPYKWSRSPGNTAWDDTAGRFGPFAEQNVLAELTNGMLLRLMLEEVEGRTQGAVAVLRRGVGSAVRLHFAEDGTLFTGLTNRGWGGRAPAHGIARVRWTGETPLEVHAVRLQPDGFELDFTLPLHAEELPTADDVSVVQYDYDYWWEYGSPERDLRGVEVTGVDVSADRRTLRISTATAGEEPLLAGRVARIVLSGVVAADGRPLLHDELAYTVNQLPGSPRTLAELSVDAASKVVPPPPGRDARDEGWLRLTYGDATALWEHEGWELVAAELDPDDPRRFRTSPGDAALTNTAAAEPSDYVSKVTFGDAEVRLDFTLPAGGSAGVFLLGRYEIRLADPEGLDRRSPLRTGGLPPGPDFDGRAPRRRTFQGPGVRHRLHAKYTAPRFDANGEKLANARILAVQVDGELVQEDVELFGPTPGAPFQDEAEQGPLVLGGRTGPVAFGDVRVKLLTTGEREHEAGWKTLVDFDEESLAGWVERGNAFWGFEDEVLVGEGPMGHLYTVPDDFQDVEVRAQLKLGDGGNSGLYLRAAPPEGNPDGWPAGYEIQINASYADPQKTGSIYNLARLTTHIVSPDTWFDLRVRCQDEAEGTRLSVWIDGVLVNELLDPLRDGRPRWGPGSIALQQHHEGSVLEVRSLSVRRLD